MQYGVLVACAIAVGVSVRAILVMPSGFALNDGGMFYSMARDLQQHGYRLPAFTSYNGGNIPFAYPPLAFYIAAALDSYTPFTLASLVQYLPLVFSCLTLLAFFLLARDLLASRVAVVTSVLFFGCLPPTVTWMVMGGGLTRALGFLFALLAIRQLRRMYLQPSTRAIVVAAVLAALTLLSHIEMGWLVCIISALWFTAYGRSRRGITATAVVGLLTLVLTAPWWGVVISQHGVSPFLAAATSTRSSVFPPILDLLQFSAPSAGIFDLVGALALLGIAFSLSRRQYLIPGWIAAVAIFDQRAFVTSATAAVAVLAAVAFDEVVLPLLLGDRDGAAVGARDSTVTTRRSRTPTCVLVAGVMVMLLVPVLTAVVATTDLKGLSGGERAAAAWAGEHTTAGSQFVVITGQPWPVDRDAEWFPALTGRTSVATVQGSEWLPDGTFDRQRRATVALEQCKDQASSCLASWAAEHGASFNYVYISNVLPVVPTQLTTTVSCCRVLEASLRTDTAYRVVYDTDAATIFQRVR